MKIIDKKIVFCATDGAMVDVWPHPKPASRFIPEEYKKLERFYNNNLHNAITSFPDGAVGQSDEDELRKPPGDVHFDLDDLR